MALLVTIATVTVNGQATVGVTGGIAVASLKAKSDGMSVATEGKVGFTLGIFANVDLGKDFAFRPGFNFTQKGGLTKEDDTKDKLTLNYIEIPLDFIYTTSAGFYVGAGPSLAFGISGKEDYSDGMISESQTVQFGNGEDELKRFDFGGNLLTGYQFKNGLSLNLNYNFGLNSIVNGTQDDITIKNRYFGIRLGYVFNKKPAKK